MTIGKVANSRDSSFSGSSAVSGIYMPKHSTPGSQELTPVDTARLRNDYVSFAGETISSFDNVYQVYPLYSKRCPWPLHLTLRDSNVGDLVMAV